MGARETRNAIINVLRSIDQANLLYYKQNPEFHKNGNLSLVTWPNHERGAEYNSEEAFGRISQYKGNLENYTYNAILKDGAFVKVSYKFHRNKLKGHSLWYWPSPFVLDDDDLDEFALIEYSRAIRTPIPRESGH